MKASLITFNDKQEIILEDGTVYRSKKNESTDDFYARVANIVDEEHLDVLEISEEVDEKFLRGLNKKNFAKRQETAGKLEKEITAHILDGSKEVPGKAPEEKVVKEKKARVVKPTAEEIAAEQEAAKKHIGKICEFTPMRGGEVVRGGIRGLMTDLRVPTVYFRITSLDEDILYHKRVNSEDLTILDEVAPPTQRMQARINAIAENKIKRANSIAAKKERDAKMAKAKATSKIK